MDGTNGSTTFTDSSLNGLTVTAVGNTQISTTQSKYGGASGYFDGSGDYLSSTSNACSFGTGDFTVEFWFRAAAISTAYQHVVGDLSNSTTMGFGFYNRIYATTISVGYTGTTFLSANQWYHYACVRQSGIMKLYLNGVVDATFSVSTNLSNTAFTVGMQGGTFHPFSGYIDDLRISRFARYVSNFTPPTTALPTTASSTAADPYYGYTSLLLHMDGSSGLTNFVDSGPNALTVTAAGNAQVSTTQSKYGGASGSFDGTGDYLAVASNAAFAFGTGDFTVEFWMYITSRKAYGYILYTQGGSDALFVSFDAAGNYLRLTNAGTVYAVSPTLNLNQWYHIAVVRSSGSSKVYVDGVGGTAVACGASFVQTGPLIGGAASANYFQGYLDDLRITKYARFTSAFTPPTQAHPNS
jgi:hypothetical protein